MRMRGIERTSEGRCKVGSQVRKKRIFNTKTRRCFNLLFSTFQFMVWVGDIDYKEYKYTLVFGEVTQGLKHLQVDTNPQEISPKSNEYKKITIV